MLRCNVRKLMRSRNVSSFTKHSFLWESLSWIVRTILSCTEVTVRRGLDRMFGFIALIHSTSATANLRTSQFTAADTSVHNILQSQLSVSWQRILNTGTTTFSLNYTLHASRYNNTRKVSSSQTDFQHSAELHSIILMPQSLIQFPCSKAHILAGWRLTNQLT
jgi:hypothetical protein